MFAIRMRPWVSGCILRYIRLECGRKERRGKSDSLHGTRRRNLNFCKDPHPAFLSPVPLYTCCNSSKMQNFPSLSKKSSSGPNGGHPKTKGPDILKRPRMPGRPRQQTLCLFRVTKADFVINRVEKAFDDLPIYGRLTL